MEKIAFLIPTLRGGGAERVVSRLSMHLCQSVPTVVITWDSACRAYEFGGQVVDACLPAEKSLIAKFVRQHQRKRKIAELCAQLNVTRVISFMESASIPLLRAKELLGTNIHISVAMRIAPSFFGPLQRWQIQQLYPLADLIIVQTAAGRSELVNNWGFSAARCRVIPNPLDVDFLAPPPSHSTRIPGLVVAVGRLAPQKRFGDLISAFSRLPRHLATQLVIVGSGSELSALSKCAQVNQVQDRVCFLGETADVMHWLDRCSLFVLSSAFEGFPNALAEAMARGCAVVSTNCETGPSEMIEHDASGLLVPVGEIGTLASAMFRVLDSQVLALQLGAAARQRAEGWSLEKIAPMWI